MKSSIALLSLAGAVLATAPSGSYPSGCSKDFSGQFEVTIGKLVSKRDAIKRRDGSCGADGILLVTLADGILTDSKGRTGYIASNYQFQFDNPVQAGTIYNSGFSVCGNDTLALGGSTTWYQCKSGSFWNLYDRNWAAQCDAVEIIAMPCGSGASGKASQIGDGQIIATELITTTIVKPLADGQPQVITTAVPVPICQIGDGQIQGHSTPCASITATAAGTTAVPVSQYSDGQIQVTEAATVTAAPATPAGTTATPVPTTSMKTVVTPPSAANATTVAPAVTGTTPVASEPTSVVPVVANNAFRTAAGSFGVMAAGLAVAFLAL